MLISLGLVLPISDYRLQITRSCKGSCLSLLTTCLVVDQIRVLFILLEKNLHRQRHEIFTFHGTLKCPIEKQYFQNKYIIYLKYSSFTNDKTFKHTLSLLKGHFEARKNERCKITFPGTDIQRKSCFMEQTYKE